MDALGIGQIYATATEERALCKVEGSYTYFRNGDVLLAKITPCFENGKLGIAKDLKNSAGFGSSEYFVIRPKEELLSEWLYYFLLRPEFRAEGEKRMTGAVGQQRVPKEYIQKTLIPIPHIDEQKNYIELLGQVLPRITKAQNNAEKSYKSAQAIFDSALNEIFTKRDQRWMDSTIGDEIKFIDYRGKTPKKTAEGIRLITAKNVKRGYLQEAPMEFIAASSYEAWMTRGIPKKGDVLFTTEAPLGNVAQLDTDEKVAFAQRIIIMQPNAARLDSAFLKYLLLSQLLRRRIREKGTGATVKGIKASLLKRIAISFPGSISAQREIVCELDKLSEKTQKLGRIYEQKKQALETLKKNTLYRAFSGNL